MFHFRRVVHAITHNNNSVTDDAYDKVYSFASNLNPKRLERKHGLVAGVLSAWIQSVVHFSNVLRDTASDRAELRRLDQVLEHAYSDDDEDFEEVDDSGWA